MNQLVRPPEITIAPSTCPHDCPSTCALEVEVLDGRTIGRVRGAEDNAYTAGVICAKVARYAERVHHPDRLLHPLLPQGAEGLGRVRADLLGRRARPRGGEIPRAPKRATARETVWPYYYAGTMGLVMRDGINRLRHAKKYSGFHSTICVNPAWTGYIAGTGKLAGPDPREMAKSDLRRDLGHQSGQHPGQCDDPRGARPQGARRQDRRGRRLQERHHGAGRPRRAGPARHRRRARLRGDALPVPRRLRRSRLSRALHRRAARARSACAHRARREWAAAHHRLSGRDDRGIRARWSASASAPTSASATASRARATAPSTCMPRAASRRCAAPGCYEGGGAFHNNGAIYHWNKTMIEGLDVARSGRSACSTSRASAPILVGEADALIDGPAGHRAADPEHQSGVGRARAGQGEARALRATICSSACTSSS